MNTLFNRAYSVTVDNLKIEDLDIAFQVQRSLLREPNCAEIRIFNLNDDHRRKLEEKKKVRVLLAAGYKRAAGAPPDARGAVSVIYSGNMVEVHSDQDGPDIITTISTNDRDAKTKGTKARVSKTFQPGTSIDVVIKEAAKGLLVGLGNLVDFKNLRFKDGGDKFQNGTVLSGNASDELAELLRSVGCEYSIQNGALQVLNSGKALEGQAIVIGPDSGLVGRASQSNDGVVRARCLMIPDLFPGRKVQFKSEAVKGFFRVVRAEYTGDTAATDWYIDIEGKPIDGLIEVT